MILVVKLISLRLIVIEAAKTGNAGVKSENFRRVTSKVFYSSLA